MAKFQFEGIDKYIAQLEKLEKNTDEIIGSAVYAGAAVVMKDVTSAIEGISTDNRFGTSENPTTGPNEYQKEGLRRSVGIAPLRNDNGFRNVKIGFDGYNGMKTKTWPQGQPNAMVARAVESGTSWMRKQSFMRKAELQAKGKCEMAMSQAIDKAIGMVMDGGNGKISSSGSGGSSGGGGGSMSTSGSRGLRKYKSSSRKTSTSKKSASLSKTLKKSVSRYKQLRRKMSNPTSVIGKKNPLSKYTSAVTNSKGSLKSYGKKVLTKKRGHKK